MGHPFLTPQRIKFALAAVLPLIVCLGLSFFIQFEIRNQHQRNEFLQGEIELVDHEIQEIQGLEKLKARLLSRMALYEVIRKDAHVGFVRIIPQLSTLTSPTVALNQVQYFRNARVSAPVLDVAGQTRDPDHVEDLTERMSNLMPRLQPDVRIWPVAGAQRLTGFRIRMLHNSTGPSSEYE